MFPTFDNPRVSDTLLGVVLEPIPGSGLESLFGGPQWYSFPAEFIADNHVGRLDLELSENFANRLKSQPGAIFARGIDANRWLVSVEPGRDDIAFSLESYIAIQVPKGAGTKVGAGLFPGSRVKKCGSYK